MYKKIVLAAVLLSSSWYSNAVIIDSITGADMDGIEVTAIFGNGATSTLTWADTGPTSGGVSTADWSLSQVGPTFGNFDAGPPVTAHGDWLLTNISNADGIVGLIINGAIANIMFDRYFTTDNPSNTPGSDEGRDFVAWTGAFQPIPNVTATYSNQFGAFDDLWGELRLDWTSGLLASGDSLNFVTDTDAVPAPGTLIILMSGLLSLVVFRKKVAGK